MITSVRHHGGWVIVLSLVIALMLTAMPLPVWATPWRPIWVVMVLVYWCVALPERVGVGISWMVGILLDVQQGTVLGQHAMALIIIAYIAGQSHRQFRVFPLAQQAVLIFFYILIFQFIIHWIRGIMGIPPNHWTFWMPALSSMLIWPWLFIVLRDVRRQFRVA